MIKKLILTLSLFALPLVSYADSLDRIVVIVNSEAILESDFKLLREKVKKPVLLFDLLLPENATSLTKGDRQALTEYLIGEKILESEIKRLSLNVTQERVEQEIRDLAKRNGISVSELYQTIKQEGVTIADYQASMKEQIERQSLIETEIISKIRISDDETLAAFLAQYPDTKVSIDEFTVSHIFFDPKKGGAEAAFERAQGVLKQLSAGENFESLAEQASEDPNFTSGGLLGTFKSGEFLKEIESAIAPLNPGQTTKVVKSRLGFHVVKLVNKKIATDTRYEREKEKIRRQLMEKSIRRQFRSWMSARRDDSFIRINSK